MIKVFSSGVFDILNLGHINILTNAKKLGDYLIVAIQDDESVKKYKGKYPILSIKERVDQISAFPFVDEIIVYNDIDQRSIWDKIKPNIIVQGDDYLHSGDRSESIKYLKEHGVRLILFPRTDGISSTEIKKRILHNNRKDLDQLKNLKLIKITDLSIYEMFEREKVDILKKKISIDKIFDKPISVGLAKNLNIVVDGNNRLQALKELGYTYIPCLCFPYKDIDLTNNVHYKKDNKITRLSEFSLPDGEIIEFKKYYHEDIINLVKEGKIIKNGETWHRLPFNIINLKIPLEKLKDQFNIEEWILQLVDSNEIRFYPSSIYTCNEWNNYD